MFTTNDLWLFTSASFPIIRTYNRTSLRRDTQHPLSVFFTASCKLEKMANLYLLVIPKENFRKRGYKRLAKILLKKNSVGFIHTASLVRR